MPENKSKTMCIYHGNCADGFGAAWVVRKALGANIEFIPGVYGQEQPDVAGKDVVLVDFSYKYDVLAELAWRAKSIIVLDHHKSAAEDLGRFEPFHAGIEEDARRDDAPPTTRMENSARHGQLTERPIDRLLFRYEQKRSNARVGPLLPRPRAPSVTAAHRGS